MSTRRFAFVSVGLTLFVGAAYVPVRAQADSVARRTVPLAEVRTSATATRPVKPDVATFTIQFNASGRTPGAAGEAVARRADSLRVALQALGIPRDSLISGDGGSNWRGRLDPVVGQRCVRNPNDPDEVPCHNIRDTTYVARDAIRPRIHDLRRLGAAIDSMLAHRVTDISPISFQATDVSATRDLALRDATALARHNAESMAEASGGRIGRTLLLTTEVDRSYNQFETTGEATEEGGVGKGLMSRTAVVQPTISVSVTVFGRWELLNKP